MNNPLFLTTLGLAICTFRAQGSTLIFTDDFTTVKPAWQFALTDNHAPQSLSLGS